MLQTKLLSVSRPFLEVQGLPQAQPMVFHQGQRPAPAGVPKLGGFTDRAFTFGSWKLEPIQGEGQVLHVFGDLNGQLGSWE